MRISRVHVRAGSALSLTTQTNVANLLALRLASPGTFGGLHARKSEIRILSLMLWYLDVSPIRSRSSPTASPSSDRNPRHLLQLPVAPAHPAYMAGIPAAVLDCSPHREAQAVRTPAGLAAAEVGIRTGFAAALARMDQTALAQAVAAGT